MTRNAKIIVTVALMLGMFLAALDTTIVGTALDYLPRYPGLGRGRARYYLSS